MLTIDSSDKPLQHDWLDEKSVLDCEKVPNVLQDLSNSLRSSSGTRRTGLLLLTPEYYVYGPQWAIKCLGLHPKHLGQEIIAICKAQGSKRVPATAQTLLQHLHAVTSGSNGTWLWGMDALLTRLTFHERHVFWNELYDMRQMPPLLITLPQYYQDFGPADSERWLQAEPCRYLFIQ